MQIRFAAILWVLCILPCTSWAGEGESPSSESSASPGLESALQAALKNPGSPYHLKVNCTDHKGIRSFDLFPGGATAWNGRSQVMLSVSARSAMLKLLSERSFSSFEDSYGGQDRPSKSAAPARITCAILLKMQGLQKSSVQMAGGEQSARLLQLASDLLDHVELNALDEVTPVDLQDALDRLADGQLAPQILRLRFVDLPARSGLPGSILHLSGGQLSHQEYTPGQKIVDPAPESIGQERYLKLISAMQSAQLASLPSNLWSEDQVELEVQVLAHKRVVLARQFTRLESANHEPEQRRFGALLIALRELAD